MVSSAAGAAAVVSMIGGGLRQTTQRCGQGEQQVSLLDSVVGKSSWLRFKPLVVHWRCLPWLVWFGWMWGLDQLPEFGSI